jgi:hypothetical protein
MPRCENCPHAKENRSSVQVSNGEACVLIDKDGKLEYVYLKNRGFAMGRIATQDMIEEYPKLVERVEECANPVMQTVTRKGILGMLGLTQTAEVCPALDLDPHSGVAVENYFVKSYEI